MSRQFLSIATACVALGLHTVAQAAFVYTNEAPNGVGDVVALTNALTAFNTLSDRTNGRIYLKPGVYNLQGVYMDSASHLVLEGGKSGIVFAGLGEGPEDTILLGEGEAGGKRVMQSGGGGNFAWLTVSNLTVTGGYTSGNGGGISGSSTTQYSHLVVSNNYAAGSGSGYGGGGCYYGRAEYCLFADNRVGVAGESVIKVGGGLWTNGGGGQKDFLVNGAFHCVFTNNWSSLGGGALRLLGKCEDCVFVGNSAKHGAAVYVTSPTYRWFGDTFTNTTEIAGCSFRSNFLHTAGNGAALYNAASPSPIVVSNCTFTANVSEFDGGTAVAYCGSLFDCVVTNNVGGECLLYNCNLERCVVSGNTARYRGASVDGAASGGAFTNANCIYANNVMTSYGRVADKKTLVNCTIVGNVSQNGGNYGYICTPSCKLVNCILSGNKIGGSMLDIRPIYGPASSITTNVLDMANCVFVKSQNGVDENWDGLVNCKQVADVKFEDAANGNYTPKTTSAAYNYGLADEWILELVGAKDIAGNMRVFGNGLDVGAYESQRWPPGMILKVW